MGRQANKIDLDNLEVNIHARNAMCSKALLDALRANHGDQDPVPEIVPEPIVEFSQPVMAPIPNSAITAASEIAFPTFPSRIKQIQMATLAQFPRMTRAELTSHRRMAPVVKARQIAMYLAKQLTEQSLPDIGRRFGGRDHTTVLHAVRKIESLIQKDPDLAAQIERIKESLPEIAP